MDLLRCQQINCLYLSNQEALRKKGAGKLIRKIKTRRLRRIIWKEGPEILTLTEHIVCKKIKRNQKMTYLISMSESIIKQRQGRN